MSKTSWTQNVGLQFFGRDQKLVEKYKISKKDQDAFALSSHLKSSMGL